MYATSHTTYFDSSFYAFILCIAWSHNPCFVQHHFSPTQNKIILPSFNCICCVVFLTLTHRDNRSYKHRNANIGITMLKIFTQLYLPSYPRNISRFYLLGLTNDTIRAKSSQQSGKGVRNSIQNWSANSCGFDVLLGVHIFMGGTLILILYIPEIWALFLALGCQMIQAYKPRKKIVPCISFYYSAKAPSYISNPKRVIISQQLAKLNPQYQNYNFTFL